MSTLPLPASHYITLPQAVDMTTRYRLNRETILDTAYKGLELLAFSETFNKEAFSNFMDDEQCLGIRIYYGMSSDLKVHVILVGVNDDDEDILPASTEIDNFTAVILEEGKRCPTFCPPVSPLNP